MVAHSQPAGDPPPGPPPAPAPGGPVPRGRRLRLILAVVGGVLALLCLGGVGIAFILYDDATKINRSEPDAVVDSYLRAYLVDRDDDQASLFSCDRPHGLAALTTLRNEAVRRETEFMVKVNVSWASLTVRDTDQNVREVEVPLTIAGVAQGQVQSRRTESWRFELVDEDGWRVCAASKVS